MGKSYSAIVYIKGSQTIAERSDGTLITSGTIGVNDVGVFQSAINYINGLSSKGKLVLGEGNFVFKTTPTLYRDIPIEGNGRRNTKIIAGNDVTIFDIHDIRYVNISDLYLYASMTQTKPIIRLYADSTFISECIFKNITIDSPDISKRNFIGIELLSNKDGIYFNTFRDIHIRGAGKAIFLDNMIKADNGSWVNGNTFSCIDIDSFGTGIEFGRDGYMASGSYGYSHNMFEYIRMEGDPQSNYGIYHRKGKGNSFIMVLPWDLTDSSHGCIIESGKESSPYVIGDFDP